ncbi:GerAB/ArcD/ProY family transporter [Brevibacillus fluminis]|uniref:GerAB/ArcD/ProY family transporter n=1 Tax=Brevibacillus fluminis TaxID=511487 RepID=UPI001605E6B1|nr:GerAB/ArcD/ProY family transporter [Brevibacillus fluminis]
MILPNLDEKLATYQVTAGIASYITGVGVVTLPRVAGQQTGTPDVWISLLLAGIISIGLGWVCAKLGQRHPGQTLFQYSQLLMGKPIGFIVNLLFVTYFLTTATYQARIDAEVIRHYLLDRTPIAFTTLCFILIAAYLVVGGINPIVRLCELLLPLTTIVIIGVMLLGIRNFHIDYFRPVLSEGVLPILKGLKATALPFSGFESILILSAFMTVPKKAAKAVTISLLIPALIYLTVIVIVIGNISFDTVKTLTWPTVEVIRSIEIPGAFFSNFEIMFIAVWVIQIFITCVFGLYFASLGLSLMMRTNIKHLHFFIIPFVYFLSLYPDTLGAAFKFGDFNGYMAMLLSGLIPLVLLMLSYIRGKPQGERHQE